MGYKDVLRSLREHKRPNPDHIGLVLNGVKPSGPRTKLVEVVSSGVGNCATPDEIAGQMHVPYGKVEEYVTDMRDKGVFIKTQVQRSSGELIDIICLSDSQFLTD